MAFLVEHVGIVSGVLLLYCATRLIYADESYEIAYPLLFLTTGASLILLANRGLSPFWDLSDVASLLTVVGYALPGAAGYLAYRFLIRPSVIPMDFSTSGSGSESDAGRENGR